MCILLNIFPVEVAASFKATIVSFGQTYNALAIGADAQGCLLWNIVPKLHGLYHLGYRARFLSPRRGACLCDEDYVGKIKIVSQACLAGTQLHHIPGRLLDKMCWGLNFRHAAKL